MYNPLVVNPSVFTTILLLTTSPICPVLQRIVIFAPLCQSSYKARTPSQNAAFYALLQQFEKGILYDKSNVHLPRQDSMTTRNPRNNGANWA